MLRANLAVMIMIALCACAGANKPQRVAAASDYKAKDGTAVSSAGQTQPKGKIVCEDEMPLGSHIPERVCRYQEDVDSVRQETQEKLHSAPAVQVKPGG